MVEEKEVIALLGSSPFCTVSDVGAKLNISRNSASKHLEILRAKGIADFRQVGPAKLWFLVEDERDRAKAQLKGTLEEALRLAREKKLHGPSLDTLEEALKKMESENEEKRRGKKR